MKLKVGDYFWNPKNEGLMIVYEVYVEKTRLNFPWFAYNMIKDVPNDPYNRFIGKNKHNGWDYTGVISKEWIHLDKDCKGIVPPAVKILYGEK